MDTATDHQPPSALPAQVRDLLAALAARDVDTAIAHVTADVVVTDQGETYTGADGVRRFLATAGSEFSYTTELLAVRGSAEHWVVTQRLEGDFPGGVADLDYTVTLRGGLIRRLAIG
ncbi:nuclear transport factor 2 family protein [uncultured Nocardioides sp.]|uniref:nuclear transport factor 2 family protein n=1 Tax=uncultured Nocardioides sp. TaxID=198441 RepID=UPI000C512675|nr:DUF4440 domain-containing protein [Nocardioides sp.]|tara:strand:- start:12 stop:362 length:351 start_codon:yes stop_codon:yes gene_type:complete